MLTLKKLRWLALNCMLQWANKMHRLRKLCLQMIVMSVCFACGSVPTDASQSEDELIRAGCSNVLVKDPHHVIWRWLPGVKQRNCTASAGVTPECMQALQINRATVANFLANGWFYAPGDFTQDDFQHMIWAVEVERRLANKEAWCVRQGYHDKTLNNHVVGRYLKRTTWGIADIHYFYTGLTVPSELSVQFNHQRKKIGLLYVKLREELCAFRDGHL